MHSTACRWVQLANGGDAIAKRELANRLLSGRVPLSYSHQGTSTSTSTSATDTDTDTAGLQEGSGLRTLQALGPEKYAALLFAYAGTNSVLNTILIQY